MSWGHLIFQIPRDVNRRFNGDTGKNHRREENVLHGFFNLRSRARVPSRVVVDNLWQMFGDLCVGGRWLKFCLTFPEQVCSHPSTKMVAPWERQGPPFHRKSKNLMGIKCGYLFILLRVALSHYFFFLSTSRIFHSHCVHSLFFFFFSLKKFFWTVRNCSGADVLPNPEIAWGQMSSYLSLWSIWIKGALG